MNFDLWLDFIAPKNRTLKKKKNKLLRIWFKKLTFIFNYMFLINL